MWGVAERCVSVCKKENTCNRFKNIKKAERFEWAKITSMEPTRACNVRENVVRG